MRTVRLVLLFLLTSVSVPASAEWVKFAEGGDGVSYYLDPATIRRNGSLRRVWILQDLKQRDQEGEMSRRALEEFDCKEERYKILSSSTHSEKMAEGNTLVMSNKPDVEWRFIPPGTVTEPLLRLVCSVK